MDDVVGYEDGVRSLWKSASSVDRSLLTFDYANHNAGAPMAPTPEEANKVDADLGFNLTMHYLDSVWDNVRMNNISTHFITAWLGKYLKHDSAMSSYFDLAYLFLMMASISRKKTGRIIQTILTGKVSLIEAQVD